MNKKDKSDKHQEVSLHIQNVLEYIPAWKVYLSKAILQQLQVGLVIYHVFRTDKVCTIYKRSYNNPLNIIHQRHKVVSSVTKCTLSIVSIKIFWIKTYWKSFKTSTVNRWHWLKPQTRYPVYKTDGVIEPRAVNKLIPDLLNVFFGGLILLLSEKEILSFILRKNWQLVIHLIF